MFRWLRSLFSNHVCKNFTPWEKHTIVCERAAVGRETMTGATRVRFTKIWQERRCVECNMHFQQLLEYGGQPPPEPKEVKG